MPQPPAASQPAPFSTPDPSRFRAPKPKRSGRDGVADTSVPSDRPTTTPASATAARPTPRFAPSWKRQSTQSQSQGDVRTPAQPAIRKFSVAGSINSGSGSRGGTASRRFTSDLSSQHRRRHSLAQGRDPFHGGGDAIEDGSSPPQAASQTPQLTVENDEEEEDGTLMVVRESPTAVRTRQPTVASQQLPPLPRPSIFSADARRRKHQSGLEEDIEDVAHSGRRTSSDDEEDVVRESGQTVGGNVVEEDNEVLMPDSGPSSMAITSAAVVATPAPQAQLPLVRQQTSAARLLSSIQPLKRRRLFVSPVLITSSPSGAGSDQEEHGNTDQIETNENRDHDRHPAFVPRFRQQKARHSWDGDDIVDYESGSDDGDSDDDNRNEDIRDIVNYGELLEYSQSSDEDHHGRHQEDNDMMDHYDDHDHDEEENEDEDMILDQTPPRIRRARERQREKDEQQRQKQKQQRMPTFQRARLFMTARKPVDDDADRDGGEDDTAHNVELSQDVTTTPARQRHYYDALLHQPPPDFFSPQKKRRQKRPRKSRHSNENDMDGLGSLTSPSAAAAAATAAAINAPEQYVPGGLAASLRDWLVQIKSGGELLGATTTAMHSGRYIVDETMQEPGMMRIAFGRRQQMDAERKEARSPVRLLLAGEARQWTTGQTIHQPGEGQSKQTVVSVSHPAWEIVLDGQSWIVASDWSMYEEQKDI